MKTRCAAVLLGFVCFASTACVTRAAALPAHMGDDSLVQMHDLPRVSVGANVELVRRDLVVADVLPGRLKSTAYSGYVGVDAWRWLTLFGTAGAIFPDSFGTPLIAGDFGTGFRWSAGFNASLWHVDVPQPNNYLKGRLWVGSTFEYMDNHSTADSGDLSWSDTAFALPIGYDIPNDAMEYLGVQTLSIYAGPVYSSIDGKSKGGSNISFSEDQSLGVLAGLDFYLTPSASVGGSIQYFNQVSAGVTARFHF